MFLLSFSSALKKQENKVSALMALQYRNYKLHLLEQTIYVRVESRKEKEKQCFPGKRLLMARTWKQRENLNSGTHLDRYFKDYLNRSDQQRKAITSGRRQQKWEGDRHGKILKLRKGKKEITWWDRIRLHMETLNKDLKISAYRDRKRL